jgi:V/A-type H+-transporting ATPase subunit I
MQSWQGWYKNEEKEEVSMAVLQMQRMNLVAMKQNRKAILERLQELGALEIDVKLEETEGMTHQDTSASKAAFERNAAVADSAIEILDKYAPQKKSLLSSLEGKPLIEQSEYEKTVEHQQEYMTQANQIAAWEKEITEANANISKLENQAEALVPWMNLDIPMNFVGTEQTTLLLGTMPEQISEESVLTILKSHEPAVDAASVDIFSSGKDATYLSVLCLKQDAQAAEEALREAGFAKPSWLVGRTPAEEQKVIEQQIEEYRNEIQNHIAQISEQSSGRENLRLASDYYRLRAEKYEVLGTLPQTANTFALSGYIPAYRAEDVAKELSDKYDAAVELEEIGEKEEAPVLLKNNAFSNSVEGVLESYGLPKKGEVDPTFFMSIFYVFLFGMMLSDAAYGAIIAVACGIALIKFPRMDEGLRKSIKLFFWCGLSTLFWGIMFGSYFGDLVNVVSKNYFGHEVSIPALWFAPLDDPMRLLIYSLLFGIIHMFIGLGMKGYMMLKDKDIVGFVSDILSWYMLLVGLILILLPTSIFESISNMKFVFPPALNLFAKVITVAGALIILVMSGRRKKKKIGMRLAIGLYDLYGITSWLSDLLSYSRLLALGLATGVIAQVINQMGSMFGTGVFGTIVFIVVFLVGTVLNLAINLLGAYVHSNRLEFVEFFNKFYDGGGKPFEPFKAMTKYVTFQSGK